MPRDADSPASKYIGLAEADALSQIQADGLRARIVGRDGQEFMRTMDLQSGRVNLVIAAGKVITAYIG